MKRGRERDSGAIGERDEMFMMMMTIYCWYPLMLPQWFSTRKTCWGLVHQQVSSARRKKLFSILFLLCVLCVLQKHSKAALRVEATGERSSKSQYDGDTQSIHPQRCKNTQIHTQFTHKLASHHCVERKTLFWCVLKVCEKFSFSSVIAKKYFPSDGLMTSWKLECNIVRSLFSITWWWIWKVINSSVASVMCLCTGCPDIINNTASVILFSVLAVYLFRYRRGKS